MRISVERFVRWVRHSRHLIHHPLQFRKQGEIDSIMLELDGTANKGKLGANAILGVSLSVCRAGAHAEGVPLYCHIQALSGTRELVMPVPALNVINGGSHAGNKLAMQEFMILPVGASSFKESMQMGCEGITCEIIST